MSWRVVDDELLSLEQLVRNMEEEEQEQLGIQEKQEAKVEKPLSSWDQQEGGIGKHGAGMDTKSLSAENVRRRDWELLLISMALYKFCRHIF